MHEDGLSGFFLQKGGWEYVYLPLVAEERAFYSFGMSCWHQKVSDLLLVKQWPEEIIKRKREEVVNRSLRRDTSKPGGCVR